MDIIKELEFYLNARDDYKECVEFEDNQKMAHRSKVLMKAQNDLLAAIDKRIDDNLVDSRE